MRTIIDISLDGLRADEISTTEFQPNEHLLPDTLMNNLDIVSDYTCRIVTSVLHNLSLRLIVNLVDAFLRDSLFRSHLTLVVASSFAHMKLRTDVKRHKSALKLMYLLI